MNGKKSSMKMTPKRAIDVYFEKDLFWNVWIFVKVSKTEILIKRMKETNRIIAVSGIFMIGIKNERPVSLEPSRIINAIPKKEQIKISIEHFHFFNEMRRQFLPIQINDAEIRKKVKILRRR